MAGMEQVAALRAREQVRAEQQEPPEPAARFQAGDVTAFDEIVAVHQEQMVRLVHRLLDAPDEVEDVVQEVFLSALQNLKRFRGESKLSTWLTRIALNKCRSHRRRRLLRLRRLFPVARAASASAEEDPRVESSEIHQQLRRAVHRLSARYREPIILRYFEGLSVPEISQALGISTGNVEVRLSRARGKLREMLPDWLGEE